MSVADRRSAPAGPSSPEVAAAWNAVVERFPGAHFRQGFEWGELRGELGWRPLRVAVDDPAVGAAACSVLCRGVRGVGTVMYAPRGPLLRASEPGALARLVHEIRALADERRAIVLRCQLGPGSDPAATELLERHGFRTVDDPWRRGSNNTQMLDLTPPESRLWSGLRSRFRNYVLAAPRRGLTIEPGTPSDVEPLHRLLQNVGHLKGFPVRDLAWYRALTRRYRATGTLVFLVARAGGHLVGGLVAVRFARTAFLLYSSARSDETQRLNCRVGPILHWEFIRQARAEGCDRADLGSAAVGSPPQPTDEGYGVYQFKAGFGCALRFGPPPQDLVFRPTLYRVLRALERQALPAVTRLARRLARTRARAAVRCGRAGTRAAGRAA